MREVVIVQAARTPIGSFNGSLSKFTATELGGLAMKEVLNRAGLDASQVDEVILGNVLPHGLGQNPARQALFKAEIPYEAGAVTVNKVCGCCFYFFSSILGDVTEFVYSDIVFDGGQVFKIGGFQQRFDGFSVHRK